jgi:hypothetical protein
MQLMSTHWGDQGKPGTAARTAGKPSELPATQNKPDMPATQNKPGMPASQNKPGVVLLAPRITTQHAQDAILSVQLVLGKSDQRTHEPYVSPTLLPTHLPKYVEVQVEQAVNTHSQSQSQHIWQCIGT